MWGDFDSEYDRNLDCPKYWDDEAKKVVSGEKMRKTPFNIENLFGRYAWVYNGDYEVLEEISNMREPETMGYLSVVLKKGGKDSDILERVRGRIKYGSLEEVYAGVKPARNMRLDGKPVMENVWDLNLTYPYDSDTRPDDDSDIEYPDDIDRAFDDCALVVLDVEDDTGFPFVMVDWYVMGCCSQEGYLIAKRERDDTANGQLKAWELSSAERERLGIGLTHAEVESRAKAKTEVKAKPGRKETKAQAGGQAETVSSSLNASPEPGTVAGTKRKGVKHSGEATKKKARGK